MVKLEYSVLNAFTQSADSGNPAAVITLPTPSSATDPNDPFSAYPPTEALQKVATKLNYPMTALLLPQNAAKGQYLLRWIDPGTEVQLCGHATVALSHHLFSLPDAPSRLELTTVKHGLVTVEPLAPPLSSSEGEKRVALDFPEILGFKTISPGSERWSQVEQGLEEVTQGRVLDLEALSENGAYVIVEVKRGQSMDAKNLPLDLGKLSHFEGTSVLLTQIAPTCSEVGGPHIYTRVLHALAKKVEDAATGSAHCALIPYYLTVDYHQSDFPDEVVQSKCLYVNQQSAEGGEMYVQWLQDRKKVRIFGSAVPIGKGEIDLDI